MTSYETWRLGVLQGIGAPASSENLDTLWAWSNAETAPYDLMRWNNPLNTTQPWPGAVNSGAQPGPHDVKIYHTVADGINATIATLLNGYYPNIVGNLRGSVPRGSWGAYSSAGAQLHLWGTGTNWLTATYGSGSGSLGGLALVIQERKALIILAYVAAGVRTPENQAVIDGWAAGIHENGDNTDQVIANLVNQPEFLAKRAAENAAINATPGGVDDDSTFVTHNELASALSALPKPATKGVIAGPITVDLS